MESDYNKVGDTFQLQKNWTLWKRVIFSIKFRFGILLVLCAIIGICLPIVWTHVWREEDDFTIESDLRYDCSPLRPARSVHKSDCNLNACIWDEFAKFNEIICYYRLELDKDISEGRSIMPSYIMLNGSVDDYVLELQNGPPFLNATNDDIHVGPIVEQYLSLSISHYTERHFRILIKPLGEDENLWSKHYDYKYPSVNNSITSEAIITVQNSVENRMFQLKVNRRSSKQSLFNMGVHSPFIYSTGHIEITTLLANDLIYGLGQSNQVSFRHNFTFPKTWTLFNQYSNNITVNTTNMYGSHPFYLGVDDNHKGHAYGVLLLNPFPIQVTTNARPSLTLQVVGGHLEFHFFMGPEPEEVIKQLQDFIYRPAMPPYWALGFHMCHSQCTLPNLAGLVEKLHNDSIPIESNCGSSLKLNQKESKWKQFSQELKEKEMKFISVAMAQQFDLNLWADYSLKNHKSKLYKGELTKCDPKNELMPAEVYFPDFFNPRVQDKYGSELFDFANGYILDMNTPLNILNGNESCPSMLNGYPWNYFLFAKFNKDNPCMDSQFSSSQLDKSLQPLMRSYLALHNLYGYKHMKSVLSNIRGDERTLVMSLSTFIGSGHYGGHLGTPIPATWTMMRQTIKQTLDFSLFGIPLTGFPVGGFRGKKRSDELLRRWYQLASVQPFMIAYSDIDEMDTGLVENINQMVRSTVKTRYQLLPYLYTLFFKAYQTGSLVVKPLFFEFPKDHRTYSIESQYMLGPALLVSPALEESRNVIMAYFPKGKWYDYYSGHLTSKREGGYIELSTVDQHVNLHLRGGYLMATQKPELTTAKSRQNGIEIIAAYDEDKEASGEVFIDDGISRIEQNQYLLADFVITYQNISIQVFSFGQFCRMHDSLQVNTILTSIKLCGIADKPALPLLVTRDSVEMKDAIKEVTYLDRFGVLEIRAELDLCKSKNYFIEWSYPIW